MGEPAVLAPWLIPDEPGPSQTVLLVGPWRAVPSNQPTMQIHDTLIIHREPRIRTCQLALTRYEPDWLLLGEGLPDDDRDSLAHAGRLMTPGIHVAVLGSEDDLVAPERWLRRGCSAYLASDSPIKRVLGILRFVRESCVGVVDKCFLDALSSQQVAPVADLTRREREVLHWMRLGRHNHEIADALSVSGSTVGFHVRN